jgi:hypothetical protein
VSRAGKRAWPTFLKLQSRGAMLLASRTCTHEVHLLRRHRMGLREPSGQGRRWGFHLQRRRRAVRSLHVPEEGSEPRPPEGLKTEVDKDGWRH